jgi:hypothetical protein
LLLPASVPAADKHFFTTPDHYRLRGGVVTIKRAIPLAQPGTDRYVLPTSQTAEILESEVRFRSLASGVVITAEELLRRNPALSESLLPVVGVVELGELRGIPLSQLRIQRQHPFSADGQQWEVAEYEASVRVGKPPRRFDETAVDSALREGPIRGLIDVLTLDGEVAVEYATTPQAEGPTRWQPSAATSPSIGWTRIAVAEEGLLRIDAQWLRDAGIEPDKVRPGEVRLYAGGKPVPLLVQGETWADGAVVHFLGQSMDGNESRERIYYLGADGSEAPAALQSTTNGDAKNPLLASVVVDRTVSEELLLKTLLGAFLSVRQALWVWADIPAEGTLEKTVEVPGLIASDLPSTLTLTLFSTAKNDQPKASSSISLNGSLLAGVLSVGTHSLPIPSGLLKESENVIQLAQDGGQIDRLLSLQTVSFQYQSRLALEEGRLSCKLAAMDTSFVPIAGLQTERAFAWGTVAGTLQLLPIRREGSIHGVELPAGTTELHVRVPSAVDAAPAGSSTAWEDLASPASADLVIITHQTLLPAAERLAAHRRSMGVEASVVTTDAVYAGFSFGQVSTEAIRDFIRHACSFKAPARRRPHSVVLFGDCTSDGRDLTRMGVPNLLPIRQVASSYGSGGDKISSDSFYSWLNEGDELGDVLVGRYSVATLAAADAAIDNLIAYESADASSWTPTLVGVADTDDFGEQLTLAMDSSLPTGFPRLLIDADTFPWEDNYYLPAHLVDRGEDSKVSPQMTAAIEAQFNRGADLVAFFGHGAPNLWSNQRFWFGGGTPNSDILRLTNGPRFPFVVSFTCNNAVIDYPLKPWNVCIAEDFMRHRGKGAIATLMPSGPGFAGYHMELADSLLRAWSQHDVREVGVLAELLRLGHLANHPADDHSRMFILLGDPSLRLRHGAADASPAPVGKPRFVAVHPQHEERRTAWNVHLQAPAGVASRGELHVDLRDEDGDLLDQATVPFALAAGESVLLPVRSRRLPEGAFVTAEMRIAADGHPITAEEIRIEHVGLPGEGLARFLDGTLSVAAGTTSTLTLLVHNPAGEAEFEWKARLSGEYLTGGTVHVPPGGVGTLGIPIHKGWVASDTLQMWLGREAYSFPLAALALPDPAIVDGSLRLEPASPSDGLTIFAHFIVENRGAVVSQPTDLHLRRMGSTEPLRDMTAFNVRTLPALLPGERRNLAWRWDPFENAGLNQIEVVIDPDGKLADLDRSNNTASAEVVVRTKWKLEPAGVALAVDEKAKTASLVATIRNRGETDAARVSVVFYGAGSIQNETTRLGDVLIDRIPAGESATATFNVPPDRLPLPSDFNPTFVVSLKGSQQRTSSVGTSHR